MKLWEVGAALAVFKFIDLTYIWVGYELTSDFMLGGVIAGLLVLAIGVISEVRK